jgi:hypothetical protein
MVSRAREIPCPALAALSVQPDVLVAVIAALGRAPPLVLIVLVPVLRRPLALARLVGLALAHLVGLALAHLVGPVLAHLAGPVLAHLVGPVLAHLAGPVLAHLAGLQVVIPLVLAPPVRVVLNLTARSRLMRTVVLLASLMSIRGVSPLMNRLKVVVISYLMLSAPLIKIPLGAGFRSCPLGRVRLGFLLVTQLTSVTSLLGFALLWRGCGR